MTWTDVTAPPLLYLPSQPLESAAEALATAQHALARARNVEWVSVAAPQYQTELAELNAHVARLMQLVGGCQDLWTRARMAAWQGGQL